MARVGRLGMAALAGLVFVDVVLVALAVVHVQGTEEAAQQDIAQNGGSQTPGPTSNRPGPDDPESPAPDQPEGSQTLVDIGDGDAVARAVSGVCGQGGAKVELSLDGGTTFQESSVIGAEVILRVASTDAEETWLVGTDRNCEQTSIYTTTNGGGSWSVDEGSGEAWHTMPEPAAAVNAPGGEVEVPCAEGQNVTSLSTLDTTVAFAMCDDGAVLGTSDGGNEWTEAGTVPGGLDVDFVDTSVGLAVATGDESCAGVAVMLSEDGGVSWDQAGCIETEATDNADISTNGDGAYVSVGSSIWYSSDGGSTWEQRTSS